MGILPTPILPSLHFQWVVKCLIYTYISISNCKISGHNMPLVHRTDRSPTGLGQYNRPWGVLWPSHCPRCVSYINTNVYNCLLLQDLKNTGLRLDDPRLAESMQKFANIKKVLQGQDIRQAMMLDREDFKE